MNDEAKPSGEELLEGVLRRIVADPADLAGLPGAKMLAVTPLDKIRAALALAVLRGELSESSESKVTEIRKIINAQAD